MKRLKISVEGFDVKRLPIDLTVPFQDGKGNAFGLEPPMIERLLPVEAGCAADRVSFCAHASGTHTECGAHVNLQCDFKEILAAVHPLQMCLVLRIKPELFGQCGGDTYTGSVPSAEPDELVISYRSILRAIESLGDNIEVLNEIQCMLILTGEPERWVFFTDQAIEFLVKRGINSLLIDKVSIDRERCGPRMPAHRGFFVQPNAIITENVAFNSDIAPGIYLLNLQLAPILGTDAVPSRVLLFPQMADLE